MELPDGARYLFADSEYQVGAPATEQQVAAMKTDYTKALTEMGVGMIPVKVEPTPAATTKTPPAVPVRPVIAKPVTVPTTATAGKVFSVSFPVTNSVTGAKVTSATMIGNPSVKGTVIKHFEQFKNGNATIRLTIPATARGKALKVNLKMVLGDESTTRIATLLIH
jgi:hypothetical protein